MQLTKNFKLSEFLPAGYSADALPKVHLANLRNLANALQHFRDTVFEGRAIHITRNGGGYRPPGSRGIAGSPHRFGVAADINVAGLTPKQVQALLSHWGGGLGSYNAHTHVDLWGTQDYPKFPLTHASHPNQRVLPARRWRDVSR